MVPTQESPLSSFSRLSIDVGRADAVTDQDLDIQITALGREGCTTIRSEKRSGTTAEGREELRTVLLSARLNE
jgi:hypothetical protein